MLMLWREPELFQCLRPQLLPETLLISKGIAEIRSHVWIQGPTGVYVAHVAHVSINDHVGVFGFYSQIKPC